MGAVDDKERQLFREITRRVNDTLPGVEVLAVELSGPERFCVYVDSSAGVDHALCERVTRVLRGYLERYSVEVSSPGSRPPMRTRAQFERAVGRRIRLKTDAGRRSGVVSRAGERDFTLELAGGEPLDVPYDQVVRANLIDDEG